MGTTHFLKSNVEFGRNDYGRDVKFWGATADHYVLWDESLDTWYFGSDGDGVPVYFYGETADKVVVWDEASDEWEFGKDDDGVKVTFYGDTANMKMQWDPAADALKVGAGQTGVKIEFYDSNVWIGSTADGKLKIAADTMLTLSGPVTATDNVSMSAGKYLYLEGTTDYILSTGANTLQIKSTAIELNGATEFTGQLTSSYSGAIFLAVPSSGSAAYVTSNASTGTSYRKLKITVDGSDFYLNAQSS